MKMQDISTVMWKEYKEVFAHRGLKTISLFVIPILLLGIFLPLQTGIEWLNNPASMILWTWLPALLATSIIADSFAGERERHTLETLLASRLPDNAILFGKIGISVLYSWGMTLASMAVALVTVNLTGGGSGFVMYSTDALLVGLALTGLVSLMVATIGVLVSLRASSVRQAQQTISILLMGPWFGLTFGIQAIPENVKAEMAAFFGNLNGTATICIVLAVIIAIDAGLVLLAQNRFKRSKLALD